MQRTPARPSVPYRFLNSRRRGISQLHLVLSLHRLSGSSYCMWPSRVQRKFRGLARQRLPRCQSSHTKICPPVVWGASRGEASGAAAGGGASALSAPATGAGTGLATTTAPRQRPREGGIIATGAWGQHEKSRRPGGGGGGGGGVGVSWLYHDGGAGSWRWRARVGRRRRNARWVGGRQEDGKVMTSHQKTTDEAARPLIDDILLACQFSSMVYQVMSCSSGRALPPGGRANEERKKKKGTTV